MKVLTFANQKGGVGKTTTAVSFASILSAKGYKTLLIDTDIQCNSSDTYRAVIEDTCTLYDLLLATPPCTLEEAIQHTEFGDIIASDPQLAVADSKLQGTPDGFFKLRDAIDKLEGYDYVIIDTNPTVNMMLYNALTVTDDIIIPITADRYAVGGLAELTNSMVTVKKYQNPKLNVAGMLLVRFNERYTFNKNVRESLSELAAQIGTKLFDTHIRESTKCHESQGARMPLIHYAPKCTTEIDYEAAVDEYLGKKG